MSGALARLAVVAWTVLLLLASDRCANAETSPKIVPSLGHADEVQGIAITPDGTWVVSAGGGDGTVKLWNRSSGRLVRTFTVPSREGDIVEGRSRPSVERVAISNDGQYVAGAHYSRAFVWNAITGDVLQEVPRFWPRRGFGAIQFSADGKMLVLGGGSTRRYNTAPMYVLVRVADGKRFPAAANEQHYSADTVHFSPNGKLLYTSGRGPVVAWTVATGKVARTFSERKAGSSSEAQTFYTSLSEDGRYLAAAVRYYTSRTKFDTGLVIWQASDGKVAQRIAGTTGEQMMRVALSHDGSRLAVVRRETTVAIHQRGTDKPLGEVKLEQPVRSLLFIEEGRRLLVASGPVIREMDAATGKVIRTLGQGFGAPRLVAVSPNGKWLAAAAVHNGEGSAVGGEAEDGAGKVTYSGEIQAWVWDITEWRLVRAERIAGNKLEGLAVDNSGRVLTSDSPGGDNDATLAETRIRELSRGDVVAKYDRTLRPSAIAPGGGAIAFSTDDGAAVWSVAEPRLLAPLRGPAAAVIAMHFDVASGRLYTVGYGGAAGWNPETGLAEWLWKPASSGLVRSNSDMGGARALPGGRVAVAMFVDEDNKAAQYAGSVQIVDVRDGKVAQKLMRHAAQVKGLDYAPKANKLLSGDWTGTAYLWTPGQDAPERTFTIGGANRQIDRVAISADARFVGLRTFGYPNPRLEIQSAQGKLLKAYEGAPEFAFTPDGERLLVVNGAAELEIWSTRAWQRESTVPLPGSGGTNRIASSLAVSPSGRRAALGLEGLHVVDVEGGRVVASIPFEEAAEHMTFGADDDTLLVGRSPGVVRLHIPTKRITHAFGYWNGETALSADARWLAAETQRGGTIVVRDLAEGGRLKQTIADKGETSAVAITNDGKYVAASREQSVRVWSVDKGELLATIADEGGAASLAFSSSGEMLFLARTDGSIGIWRWRDNRELATLYSGDPDTWLVMTPAGFFAGTEQARKLVTVVSGTDQISVEQVFEHLGKGDLVIEQMKGDPESKYDKARGELDLRKILKSGAAPSLEMLGDEKLGSAIRVKVRIKDEGGGIGKRLVWRLNGQARGETSLDGGTDQGIVTAERVLQIDPSKQHIVEAVAYNSQGLLASEPLRFYLNAFGTSSSEPPRMYVLAVGVSDYANPDWFLKLAAGDAKEFSKLLEVSGKGLLYYDVKPKLLVNEQVTEKGLAEAFASIAKDPQIKTSDLFVLYLAGHGRYDGSRYYYIPQDLDTRKGQQVRSHGISQEMLQKWIASIEVDKRIVVIDTCESAAGAGSVIRALANPRLTAMEQLQHATGDNLLAAAGQAAFESNKLGHGLLTYAVLEAMAKRAGAQADEQVTFDMVASHALVRVPELSREIFGQEQWPIRKASAGVPIPLGFRRYELQPVGDVVAIKEKGYVLMRDEVVRTGPSETALTDPPISLVAPTAVDIVEFSADNFWVRIRWGEGAGVGWVKADAIRKLRTAPN